MAACQSPFKKKDADYSFPCGKCYDCKQRRISGWSFRLTKEAERSTSAFFITLTYDFYHVPITQNKFMSLDKKHPQLWFKKLRKINSEQLKYYLCGEYGENYQRPHYHVILLNGTLASLIGEKYAKQYYRQQIKLDGKQSFLCGTWEHGHITVGQVNEASIGYTLMYITKPSIIPMHRRDDRQKEFSLMSKGIGSNYLTPQMQDWHKNDLYKRMYVPLEDGKKIAMPRYYKQKIYTDAERQRIGIRIQKELLREEKKRTKEQNLELRKKEHYIALKKSEINSKDIRTKKSL